MTDQTGIPPVATMPLGGTPAPDTPEPAVLPNGMPQVIIHRFDGSATLKLNLGGH